MISACFGARIAELRHCSAERFPKDHMALLEALEYLFSVFFFPESAYWNFFWDLKKKRRWQEKRDVRKGEAEFQARPRQKIQFFT